MVEKVVGLAVILAVVVYWYRVERPKDIKRKKERQMMEDWLC